jgi:chromosome partition protein MukB
LITPDFQALKKNILHRDIQGQANDFSSVDEYHRHLFAQGLLPVSMDRQGKKKFAALWSQVTRPKLDRLGAFLMEMLCPDPAQGVKFADVERLMRDRRKLTEQLQALDRFRAVRQELEEKRSRVDDRRRLYLSTELGRMQAAIRSCREKLGREKEREARTSREMQELEERLRQSKDRKSELSQERDKYVSRQDELSRQQKHHQEYVQALEREKTLQEQVADMGTRLEQLETEGEGLTSKREDLKARSACRAAQVSPGGQGPVPGTAEPAKAGSRDCRPHTELVGRRAAGLEPGPKRQGQAGQSPGTEKTVRRA